MGEIELGTKGTLQVVEMTINKSIGTLILKFMLSVAKTKCHSGGGALL